MNITECRITRHAVQCTPVCSVLHGITTDTKPPVLIWLCNNPWINLSVWVTSYVSIVGEGVMSEWWGAGVVICLEWGADLYMAQLMPLPLTVSCFSKIQIGFTFLVPAHPGSPGKRAVKRVCVGGRGLLPRRGGTEQPHQKHFMPKRQEATMTVCWMSQK